MSTVRTQKELQVALQRKERKIIVKGPLADKFINRKKKSKIAKFGGVATLFGGILALPFTGGASAGAAAMGLTIGTLTISTAELAILVGGAVAAYGIKKGCKITNITRSGDTENTLVLEPNYKN